MKGWTREAVNQITGKTGNTIPDKSKNVYSVGRMPAAQMNKTEYAYAVILEARKFCGEITWWAFEPINIRLAPKCFFRVDFLVMLADGSIEAHEVKGGAGFRDDALVKIKVASTLLPFKFIAIQLVKGVWKIRNF